MRAEQSLFNVHRFRNNRDRKYQVHASVPGLKSNDRMALRREHLRAVFFFLSDAMTTMTSPNEVDRKCS